MALSSAQRAQVITLGFCGLVSAADNWFVSPALPAIANALAVAPSAAAIILTAYLTPYGLLQPVCGAIGDAVGRIRLLRIIVFGLCASTLLCAAAPTLGALVAARIVTGCFAAGIISVSQAFVGDVVDARDRSGAVGLLMGITFTGQGLSAGLGGILTELIGWRAAFACFGVLAAVAWLGLLRMRAPAGGASRAGVRGGLARGAFHETGACGSGGASRLLAASREFFIGAGQIFFGPHRHIFFLATSTGIIFLGVYGFVGVFLAEVCGASSTVAGIIMMFYGVACLLGGALTARIGRRGGISRVILCGEASGMVAICALMCSLALHSRLAALAACACLGFGYIWVQPSLVTLSMGADPERAGLCTGLVGLGVFAGGGLGGVLGQIVLGAGGYGALWAVALIALALQTAFGLGALKAGPKGDGCRGR